MVFEIRYDSKKSDLMGDKLPRLSIDYRESGRLAWTPLVTNEIDCLAFCLTHINTKYYNHLSIFNLKSISEITRLETMSDIIDEVYDGSFEGFVYEIAKKELKRLVDNRKEEDRANDLRNRFTIRMPKYMRIEVEEEEDDPKGQR